MCVRVCTRGCVRRVYECVCVCVCVCVLWSLFLTLLFNTLDFEVNLSYDINLLLFTLLLEGGNDSTESDEIRFRVPIPRDNVEMSTNTIHSRHDIKT